MDKNQRQNTDNYNMLSNSRIKYLSSLKQKKFRRRERRFLAEGGNLIKTAIEIGFAPEEIFYSIDYGQKKIEMISSNGLVKKSFITNSQMKRLSQMTTPPGIIALMPFFDGKLADFESFKKILFFDKVSDPGNAGTLIRNACAFGFEGVLMSEGSCDIYNAKLLRSSAGYVFHIPILDGISIERLAELKQKGFKLISTSPNSQLSIEETECPEKSILILGNEPHGVSNEIKEIADMEIKIPLMGDIDSLNVASAGAVLMYWARNKSPVAEKK